MNYFVYQNLMKVAENVENGKNSEIFVWFSPNLKHLCLKYGFYSLKKNLDNEFFLVGRFCFSTPPSISHRNAFTSLQKLHGQRFLCLLNVFNNLSHNVCRKFFKNCLKRGISEMLEFFFISATIWSFFNEWLHLFFRKDSRATNFFLTFLFRFKPCSVSQNWQN